MITAVRRALVGDGDLSYRQGAVSVLTAGVLFSFTAILFRGLENSNDWQFLTIRGGSTALVLLIVALIRRKGRPVPFDQITGRTVVAGLLLASMSVLFILALARTTAALTIFMLAAAPFSGAFFGRVVLRERVSMVTVGAMAAAVAGVAIMVGSGIDAGQTSGVILAAAIPIMLGLYNVLIRSGGTQADPVLPAIIAGVALLIVAGIVSLVTVGLEYSVRDLLLGFGAGGIALGIGLPLYNVGHRSVPTAQVSLLNLSEIVLAPLWVWIWPGEVPSSGTLVGGAVVLAAVVYLVVASDRESRISTLGEA
jgi:drug/metabolite transporter (DMT)-like permease